MKKVNLSISKALIFLAYIFISFSGIPYISALEIPLKVEVVTSIPVETSLKGKGTRRASEVWVEMINKAGISIDFAEFYLISEKNELLEPVINALKKASARGVKIRFLIDKKMLNTSGPLKTRLESIKNVDLKIFDWSELGGGIVHAKYFIVDNREVFIGSQNFDWRALKHIHETGLRISEPGIVMDLKRIFEVDWKYNSGDETAYSFQSEISEKDKNTDMFLTASPEKFNPPGIESSLKKLKEMITGAEKSINIQLLNYKTRVYKSAKEFTELFEVLEKAASRGVQIKFAVADWNLKKPGIESIKSLAKVNGIIVKVFTIPEYSKGFIPYSRVIHSKVMRVDDHISWVGTSNWGHDYFYSSRNVEVVLKLKKVALILDSLFEELWDSEYGQILDPEKEYIAPKTH